MGASTGLDDGGPAPGGVGRGRRAVPKLPFCVIAEDIKDGGWVGSARLELDDEDCAC